MPTAKPNPLFSRGEKRRFRKHVRGAARKGLSKIFGIPLSRGFASGPGAKSSRQGAHRSAKPSTGAYPSNAVRSDVISALKDQGYSGAVAKKMAEGVRAGDDFESAFRRVISRNPGELIIFGNPQKVYGRKSVAAMKRTGNPIPAALISAFEASAGSKLFDAVSKGGKRRNSHEYKPGSKLECSTCGKKITIPAQTGDFDCPSCGAVYKKSADYISLVQRGRRSKKNPTSTEHATQLFETFHHREAEGVFERQRSAKQRKGYTILGPLVAIGINPEYFDKMEARAGKKQFADWAVEHYDQLPRLDFMTPGQVDDVKIMLGDPDKYVKEAPLLASSPNGRQLYALAEDVQIDLSKFDTDAHKDYVDLGDATFVVYIAKKPHEVREWVHMLGEDGGTRPRLMFDKLRKEVCFIGGSYVVKGPGIMH